AAHRGGGGGPMKAQPDINDTLRSESIDAVRERHDKATRKYNSNDRPQRLDHAHNVFQHWLGNEYDLSTLDAMVAVAACERLPGDPAWLLIISGPGNAKTETVQATSRLGARVVSTLSSIGALLSASSHKQRTKGATGGLLREIGERGILAIKD